MIVFANSKDQLRLFGRGTISTLLWNGPTSLVLPLAKRLLQKGGVIIASEDKSQIDEVIQQYGFTCIHHRS